MALTGVTVDFLSGNMHVTCFLPISRTTFWRLPSWYATISNKHWVSSLIGQSNKFSFDLMKRDGHLFIIKKYKNIILSSMIYYNMIYQLHAAASSALFRSPRIFRPPSHSVANLSHSITSLSTLKSVAFDVRVLMHTAPTS